MVFVAQATPMSQKTACSQVADTTVAGTVGAQITWLRHVPGLIATAPTPVSIDGHAGQSIDLRLNPTWKTACPGGPGPEVDYLLPDIGLAGTAQRQRLILLDLGSGDLAAIVVNSDTTAPFSGFVTQAMPVIASFKFQ